MTKQEFLAMSLPYELKCKEVDLNTIFNFTAKTYELMSILNWSNSYQPILRPLSDLKKKIEHNGEKFVPIKKIREEIGFGWCHDYEESIEFVQVSNLSTLKEKMLYLPFEFIQLLISWHFDIADLISKGEAIDVNTLEINPYK